jgi:hypothetical protein
MWNGIFEPVIRKSVADHFKVINISENLMLNMYYVTIEFHNTPNKHYVFEIPAERFKPTKEAIGEEVLKQLRAES